MCISGPCGSNLNLLKDSFHRENKLSHVKEEKKKRGFFFIFFPGTERKTAVNISADPHKKGQKYSTGLLFLYENYQEILLLNRSLSLKRSISICCACCHDPQSHE